jgi:FdhE protein
MIVSRFAKGTLVTAWTQNRATWPKRIERAEELAERNPWAGEVLGFYRRILAFQKEIYENGERSKGPDLTAATDLRTSINLDRATDSFSGLLTIVQAHGPAKLVEDAGRLRNLSQPQVRHLLEQFLASADPPPDSESFFARIVLQPEAERLAQVREPQAEGVAGNRCPYCDSRPQLAVIRPEGDGGKRFLLCSRCQSEWEFRRILCPVCGEENHEKLPRYSAEGILAVRVEACDTCKSYLKSVDLTVDGLAVPVVDDVATAPLDLWAVEHDYRKIEPNIMGF